MQVSGKVFAVTGGGNGIGREVVLGLVKKGARVAALDLSEAGLAETVHLAGDHAERISTLVVNVTDRTAVATLPAAIVNVSSMGAYAPVPGQSVYGATKAAVAQLSRALHSELTETGVQVTGVFPGAIGTNITINSGIMTEEEMKQMAASGAAERKTTAPVEADRQIIEAVEKGSDEIFIGSDSRFMSRLWRLNPKRAAALIYSQMKDLLG